MIPLCNTKNVVLCGSDLSHLLTYVTCSIEIRNKMEMPSLAVRLQSARRGEFGCDGIFSGFDVYD